MTIEEFREARPEASFSITLEASRIAGKRPWMVRIHDHDNLGSVPITFSGETLEIAATKAINDYMLWCSPKAEP